MTRQILGILATVAASAFAADQPKTLTLDEALKVAREHQPQVQQAQANTQAALARVDEAFAPLLPQVSGTASYSPSTGNYVARPGSLPGQLSSSSTTDSWKTYNYFNLGLSASQLLYDFKQSSSRWRASQASARSQQASEKSTLQQVLFNVRNVYFQARADKELLTVARETLANQQKHLQQTQGFVEVGTQPEIALAQSKTNVANAQVQLITAENNYALARAQLNQAMGVEQAIDYDVADETAPPVEDEDAPGEVLAQEALQARPEVAVATEQVRAQELTVRSIQGAYGPTLGLSTGFTDAGEQTSNLAWNWSASLVLSVPLFQGGLTRSQVREATANVAVAKAQLATARQQVLLDVEQARLSVRAARTALDASGEALANATDQLHLAEGRYEVGVGSIIELSDSQLALTTAAQQRVQAEYNLAQARAGLVKALGRD
jgi:outer membrane protein